MPGLLVVEAAAQADSEQETAEHGDGSAQQTGGRGDRESGAC